MSYETARGIALLTVDEERDLAQAIEAGREASERIERGEARPEDPLLVRDADHARHRFIESNLRLVFSIAAKTLVPSHIDRQDVIQDGMLGLDRAVIETIVPPASST